MRTRRRFSSLDALRGLCALLVALLHYGQRYPDDFSQLGFFRSSFLFVDFFFVLSGFVLAHAYASRLRTPADLAAFALRRIGRLWPLHMMILGVFVATVAAKWLWIVLTPNAGGFSSVLFFTTDGPPNLAAVTAYVLLAHSLGMSMIGPAYDVVWNLPSWSISTELWTNLLFGAFCLAGQRGRAILMVVAVALSILVLVAFVGSINTTSDFGIFRCIYGFFTGYAVYRIRGWRAVPPGRPTWLEGVCLLAVAGFVSAMDWAPGYFTLLAPLVFGLTIHVFAFDAGAISTLLQTRPLQAIGRWSYSIYMIHYVLLQYVMGLVARAKDHLAGADGLHAAPTSSLIADVGGAAFLAAVVVLAALTYRLVERPGRSAFYRLAGRLGGASGEPVADDRVQVRQET